jgi:hypothetical protein
MSETIGLHGNGIVPIIRRDLPRSPSLLPPYEGVLEA